MGRTLMMVAIAGGTCILVLWLVAPRLLPLNSTAVPPAATSAAPAVPVNSSAPPASSALPPITANGTSGSSGLPHIQPIQTPAQKAVDDYEAQRAPFYTLLQDQFRDLVVEGRPATEDRSILILYTTRSDTTIVTDILAKIVAPYAYAYGFRHVRFYLPNPRGSVEHYHLAAEANADEQGNWQAFQH